MTDSVSPPDAPTKPPFDFEAMLAMILDGEDHDSAYIIAGLITIYVDAVYRRQRRLVLRSEDVIALFKVCRVILGASDPSKAQANG